MNEDKDEFGFEYDQIIYDREEWEEEEENSMYFDVPFPYLPFQINNTLLRWKI